MFACTRFYPAEGKLYTALLWQKEASDIPSKSELLTFHILPSVLFFQAKSYA